MADDEIVFLHVEDDPIDAQLFRREMSKSALRGCLRHATDGGDALDILRTDRPRRVIVLLDLNMPGLNGHDFLAELRSDPALQRVLVFVLTSSAHERDLELAYDKHVAGYFNKSEIKGVIEMLGHYSTLVNFPPAK